MNQTQVSVRGFEKEYLIRTSRSSGPGGQNVNKVNSKVELRFNSGQSNILNEWEKQILLNKLASKITLDGELIVVSQEHRSQLQNKNAVLNRFYTIISIALTPVRKRKPTRPTGGSIERRLKKKKQHALKKADRRYRAM